MRTISGDEARALIESQLAAHGNGVFSVLAQYRCNDAVAAWHETIRAVEEFINLPKFGVADLRLRAWLCAIRLDGAFVSNPGPTWLAVRQALAPHLEPSVIARFTRIMLYAGAIGEAFAEHGKDARSASIRVATRRSCAGASAAMSQPIAASSGILGRTNTGVHSAVMCYSCFDGRCLLYAKYSCLQHAGTTMDEVRSDD